MRIIAKRTLKRYWESQPRVETELKAWYDEAKRVKWRMPSDVKAKYGSASILQNGRVVFNICGNRYRLVVRIHYDKGVAYVRFIGTHREYDSIDAQTI
jgi:mRNA interferase HigB